MVSLYNLYCVLTMMCIDNKQRKAPYYEDELFDKMKTLKDKQMTYDPMSGMSQDGQESKGYTKSRMFIKPFTLYNFQEKQLFTLRPRNSIYQCLENNTMVSKRVGYLVMKI